MQATQFVSQKLIIVFIHKYFHGPKLFLFSMQKLMEIYGKLYDSHKIIVSSIETGKRYLGTYFRVTFYGEVS